MVLDEMSWKARRQHPSEEVWAHRDAPKQEKWLFTKDGLQVNYLPWAFQGRRSLLLVRMGRIGRGFTAEETSELELWTRRGRGWG